MELVLQIMVKCDLMGISDGVKPWRYAVSFAARDSDVMDYLQGDDLEALLKEVLDRVSVV